MSKLKIKRPAFTRKSDKNVLKKVDDKRYLPKSPRNNNNTIIHSFNTIDNIFEMSSINNDEQNENKSSQKKVLMRQISNFSTFNQLMKYNLAIEYFKEFLTERSKQNEFIFYLEIQELKRYYNDENAEDLVTYLINNYIEESAIFLIELDNEIRDNILNLHYDNKYSRDIFDKAEKIVLENICKKYFPEFKKSPLFQQFCQIDYQQNQLLLESTYRIGLLTSEQKTNKLLNNFFNNSEEIPNPNKFIQELLEILIDMLNVNFSISSETINCQKIAQSISFKNFQNSCSLLNNIAINDIVSLDHQSKKAFFLNLFNVISIHSIIINPNPTDKNSLNHFLKDSNYSIGGYVFSLHDIKYGVFELSRREKKKLLDKLTPFCVNYDPRINFAIMNFTTHPNKLTTFYPETLEKQLDETTVNYLNQYLRIKQQKKKIYLPIINKDNFYNYENAKIWIRNYLTIKDPISFHLNKLGQTKSLIRNSIDLNIN
ncbi:electron carrier/ protein disulfide oxidoreductase [Anaeramoeba flamelloides]|nr:electron carrier/ protein disulfide oxidoreductase [Anaeramoeba flamelloides]